jgi:DNA polymerase-3 subunit alpha
MGIPVVPPNVNRSTGDFNVENGEIVFGMAAIKGCGAVAATAIAAERTKGGPYRSLFDFCERLDPSVVGRAAIESLTKSGAFDTLHPKRAQVLAAIERAMQSGAAALADRRRGQKGLFDADDDPSPAATTVNMPDVAEWEHTERLSNEKEVLGFYLSSHPLEAHQETLSTYCSHTTVGATALANRTEALLGGVIASLKQAHTKNPRPGQTNTKYAMFDLEDLAGIMRCIVWPETYAKFGHVIQPDAMVALRGSVDKRAGSEDANFIVDEVIALDELPRRYTKGVMVYVNEGAHSERHLEQLREIIRGYPGTCDLQLVLTLADGGRVACPCPEVKIELNAEMRLRIDELLGPGSLKPIRAKFTPTNGNGNGNGHGRNGYASRRQ